MSHALLSPSSAHRWMNCTASARAAEHIVDRTSIYAARGTVLHDLASTALETGKYLNEPGDVILQEGFEIKLTRDDLDQVDQYVDYVRKAVHEANGTLLVEQKLDLRDFIPESKGTADAVIIEPIRELHVIDAKFGSGVRVQAADNPQLIAYGIGAWLVHGPKNFVEQLRCTIVQPPLNHVDSVVLTEAELDKWKSEFMRTGLIAFTGEGATYAAGDHCKFCPIKAGCPELGKLASQRAAEVFDAVVEGPELGAELDLIPALEAWIKSVREEAHSRLEQGQPVPGYKLVEGRRARNWRDESRVEAYLRSKKIKIADMFDTKLRSVAQMEKVLGKDFDFGDLVEVKTGKPTIAPESDKRKAIGSGAELIFD